MIFPLGPFPTTGGPLPPSPPHTHLLPRHDEEVPPDLANERDTGLPSEKHTEAEIQPLSPRRSEPISGVLQTKREGPPTPL